MKNYIYFQVLILLASAFLKAYGSEAITDLLHLHSFKSPFLVSNLNNGWQFEYATINTRKYVVLIPNICNRRGLLYHEKPILSDNITIEFSFHIYKKYQKQPLNNIYYTNKNENLDEYKINVEESEKKNGFGFWILENNLIDKTESNELEDFSLFGYKKKFNGVGTFFELKQDKLIVYSLFNNGNSDINTNDAIVKTFYLNSIMLNDLIVIKATSYNNEINISMYEPQTMHYTPITSIKKKISEKNYIGFTAFNFQESENVQSADADKYEPTFVGIKEVRIYSITTSHKNKTNNNQTNKEDNNKNDLSIANLNKSINNILKEFSPHNSQVQQTEALKKLTNLFQIFMLGRIKHEQKMLDYINLINIKLQSAESELINIRKHYINKLDDPKSIKNVFTTELTGLKNLFNTHTQHHKKAIEDITSRLTKKIDNNQELKIIAEKTQKLEHIINKGNSTTYIFAIGFTGLIVTTLFLVYKKIRDVEKKHIL